MKRVFVAMSVAAFIFLGTSGAVSAQDGSGQDYVTLLDKFMVDGPGAAEPGWFDDFDDGDLGDWICWWGTCQDVPGTTYARFESPGEVVGYAGLPVSYEESSVGSWIIPESYVSGEEWFQGVAIFAAELPHANESIFLALTYGPFDWDGNGTMVYEVIGVFIEITSPAIATIFGNPTVGLQLQQGRGVFDENWNIISYSEWDSEQLTAPNALGNVVLSIRYHEGPGGFVYHAGYSLTGSLDVVEPLIPMESHLHLSGVPGTWGIGAHVDFLNADIDIKPGSDPNCFNLNGHGVIPVAINGSEEFDVDDIDAGTLIFDGLTVRVRGNKGPLCSIKDWNNDGFLDLVCHFEDDPGNWTGGDSTATITGYLVDGTSFAGTDSFCIVP